MMKNWFKTGAPWVWLNAAAVSVCLILVLGIVCLIAVRGLANFWPADIYEFHYRDGKGESIIVGEWVETKILTAAQAKEAGYPLLNNADFLEQRLLKTGNRDLSGMDFRWVDAQYIQQQETPKDLIKIERREWGNFYGRLKAVKEKGQVIAEQKSAFPAAQKRIERARDLYEQIEDLQKGEIGSINYALERLRLKQKRLELDGDLTEDAKRDIARQRQTLQKRYQALQQQLVKLNQAIMRDSLVAETGDGRQLEIPLKKVVNLTQPNAMNGLQKTWEFIRQFAAFISEDPREANTEGGVFPAIFGTIIMVMLMAVLVTPFGVIAAVYMREYASQGPVTRLIRIAVNNLAGVPSIVYGVFGLGFFVYFLGGNIDDLFFPEAAPAPVFGTPGLLWASLTLALLTLPVVIVSTEEGLARIPKSIREGSLALGATKLETLWHTVLPMATPAMMTGLILAVARAAGEVAPLMLVGVVKLAPTLPLDGNYPFLHLDRKFMHLGFHIYDVGFQSPNVEAARPLVYATSLLLILVIIGLNLFAINIRNSLREKYRALEN